MQRASCVCVGITAREQGKAEAEGEPTGPLNLSSRMLSDLSFEHSWGVAAQVPKAQLRV